ncbi:MAG: hypothetical protein ACO1QB_08450 [Verrucomicrobiales bacterium]
MKLKHFILFGMAAGQWLLPVQGQSTNTVPTGATGFDERSFRIISERNIFNQSRSSRSSRNNNPNPESERPRPVQVDSFSLVGTMVYDKGPVAFMVGSNSDFQKPIKPGDEIGGFKVLAVAPNLVTLAKEDQKVEMRIGMQMRRQDAGEWKLLEEVAQYSSSSTDQSSSSEGGESSSSGGSSPEEDEIMKRLMEKRAKELNK